MKLFLSLLLFSSSAFAQFTCNYEGGQREMNECAIRDYQQADTQLNLAYARAMMKLSHLDKITLRDEQRQWIRRRDARCMPKRKGEGTNLTIDFLSCMQDITEIRTLQLENRVR